MSSTAPISAKHLSLLMSLGGGIAIAALIPAANPHRKTIAFAVFTLGVVIMFASHLCLIYGIKHHQFDDKEVERLHLNTKSVLWTALHGCVSITALVFLIVPLLWENLHSLRPVGFAALTLSSTLNLVKSSAATPAAAQLSLPAPSAPINSNHWGQS